MIKVQGRFVSFVLAILVLVAFSGAAQAKLVGKTVNYKVGNDNFVGYLTYDDKIKGKRPGVIVVHEWWGHNAYARNRADMLAKLGYTAIALDMYGDGKTADHPKDAQAFSSAVFSNMDQAEARFKAAKEVLANDPHTDASKIAAIGYCFGGGIVLAMARRGLDLKGVVSFHGSLGTQSPAQPGNVKAKVLICHGEKDPFTKPEQIAAFKDEMKNAGVDYKFVSYPNAKHAFTNPEASKFGKKFKLPLAYNKAADKASWKEMKGFLKSVFK